MKKLYEKCDKCGSKMTTDCEVSSYRSSGIVIKKKREGIFNSTSDYVKASVCPNCGNVNFYIEDSEKFMD